MPRFMITIRSISGDVFGDAIGALRYLVVPDNTPPAPSHALARTDWIGQVMQTFGNNAGGNAVGNLVFLVHGFNTSATNAVALHDQVTIGLVNRLACTIISFDWPSADETYAYLPDLDTAKRTAINLVTAGIKPLILAQTDDCRVGVHVVCHSMGAYVVREALDHADDGLLTGSDWALNQLVIIAGDVEAADFVDGNKDTESMLGHSYRLTNYFNKFDEVLQISNGKRLGTEPRVGRIGLPPNAPAKTVNIDCSDRFSATQPPAAGAADALLWSHSWYFADPVFYSDLAATLNGTVDRTVVAGRTLAADGRTLILG